MSRLGTSVRQKRDASSALRAATGRAAMSSVNRPGSVTLFQNVARWLGAVAVCKAKTCPDVSRGKIDVCRRDWQDVVDSCSSNFTAVSFVPQHLISDTGPHALCILSRLFALACLCRITAPSLLRAVMVLLGKMQRGRAVESTLASLGHAIVIFFLATICELEWTHPASMTGGKGEVA